MYHTISSNYRNYLKKIFITPYLNESNCFARFNYHPIKIDRKSIISLNIDNGGCQYRYIRS